MPAKPIWYSRLDEIKRSLAHSAAPVVDRAAIEKLFGLGRRQAINLMRRFDGHLSGRHWFVDRLKMIERLGEVALLPGYGDEIRRKVALKDQIEILRKTNNPTLQQPITTPPPPEKDVSLPQGARVLKAGQMLISYQTTAELLGILLALTQEAVDDYAGFDAAVTSREDAA
jgi:hypothetical protein